MCPHRQFFSQSARLQTQVGTGDVRPAVDNNIKIADLVVEVLKKQTLPEKPQENIEPPPLDLPSVSVLDGTALARTKAVITPDDKGSPGEFFLTDTNAIPLVQVQPAYPQRALQKGIEGYVIVEFDVDDNGQVINPRVLYAQPTGYFESASLRALERYRYQPKVMNGQAVKMFGVQQKLIYGIE